MSAENPTVAHEPVHHSFKEIEKDVTVVNPGDTITGFETLVELDRCAAALARVAFREHRYTQDERTIFGSAYYLDLQISAEDNEEMRRMSRMGKVAYRPWPASSKMPSGVVVPSRFRGLVTDIKATLLGGVEIDDATTTCPFNLSFSANLESTGRGIIGRPFTLMSGVEKLVPNPERRFRRPVYQDLSGDDATRAVQRLRAESSINARRIESENLRRIILSGIYR